LGCWHCRVVSSSFLRSAQNARPFESRSLPDLLDHGPQLVRHPGQIETAVVGHACDGANRFFEALRGSTPLSALEVNAARRKLQKDAGEFDFITHGLEEELFKFVARFEVVVRRQHRERGMKARIVADVRQRCGRRIEHAGMVKQRSAVAGTALLILFGYFNVRMYATSAVMSASDSLPL
jgi:hypothetical protein